MDVQTFIIHYIIYCNTKYTFIRNESASSESVDHKSKS